MSILYLLLFLSTSNWFCVQAIFPPEFFQIVNIDISYAQSEASTDSISKLPLYINVSFSAFGRSFEVTAHKAVSIDPEITIEVVGTKNHTFNWIPPLYEGRQSYRKTVMGMYNLRTNAFVGFVTDYENTYYMEPAKYHFPDQHNNTQTYLVNRYEDALEFVLHSEQNKESETCFMELTADYTVYEAMNKDINSIASRLYFHVRYADFVLKNTNFGDKTLRLSTKNITIYNVTRYPFYSNYSLPDYYLRNFSYFINDACIAAIFTHTVYGTSKIESITGIAEGSSACSGLSDSSLQTNRLMVMSRAIANGSTHVIPLSYMLTVFAHEVGHTFGALHNDPRGGPYCFVNYNGLRYLLSRIHVRYRDFRTPYYSICNIRRMKAYIQTIQSKGTCLKNFND